MVKHMVMWKLDEALSETEKTSIKKQFKEGLEALDTLMEGIIHIHVYIDPTTSSNMDIMLDSAFVSQDVLDAYQIHPKHQAVASLLKGKAVSRNCMDYHE